MSPESIVALSKKLAGFTETVGKFGSWWILPLVFVTMWDVIVRKLKFGDFSLQIWLIENGGSWFESTKIQEFEWHFHTALFALVLGYGYVYNRHVRVDLVREHLSFRKQAWIEFLGCTFFFIPFCSIVTYFALQYAWDAWTTGEISASTVGLSHRWIIKTVFVCGIIVAAVSGVAVWLQTALVLFGPKDYRFELMTLEWPEEQERKARARREANAAKKEQAESS
jgi:TRAP-type mannitol/chloroaromatic compound transport system permease small subunit